MSFAQAARSPIWRQWSTSLSWYAQTLSALMGSTEWCRMGQQTLVSTLTELANSRTRIGVFILCPLGILWISVRYHRCGERIWYHRNRWQGLAVCLIICDFLTYLSLIRHWLFLSYGQRCYTCPSLLRSRTDDIQILMGNPNCTVIWYVVDRYLA